jgi:protein-tyrosine phosphatase family protein
LRVVFPDGTAVEARGLRDRREDATDRDFGLYMDPDWAPTWPAELIDWEDFGLPADPARASEQIRAAFERARNGERVEVGCAGGLGRTGTVLACMATLAGVPAADAVAWVRANYDDRAIETPEQEVFVRAFS